MQSCPRWLPLVWFTRPSIVITSQINSPDPGKYLPDLPDFRLLLVKLIAQTQANTCLSCPISCSTTPGVTHMSSAHVVHACRPCTSSEHHPGIVCTLFTCQLRMRVCCLHQDTSSAHHLYIICAATHGQHGSELSFTVTGICYWMEFVAGMLNFSISGLCKWFAR